MKVITIAALFATLSGCAVLSEVESGATGRVAEAVDSYCLNTPYPLRKLKRMELNTLVADGTEVTIKCPGDPE